MSDPKNDPWMAVIAALGGKHHLPDWRSTTVIASKKQPLLSMPSSVNNNNNNNNNSSHRRNENDHVKEIEHWLKEPVPGQWKDNHNQQHSHLLLTDLVKPLDTEAACKALHLEVENLKAYCLRLKQVIAGAFPELPVNDCTSPALLLPFLQLPPRVSQNICLISGNLLSLDCLAGCFYGIEQAEKQLQQQQQQQRQLPNAIAAAAPAAVPIISTSTPISRMNAAQNVTISASRSTFVGGLDDTNHFQDFDYLRFINRIGSKMNQMYSLKVPLFADNSGRAYHTIKLHCLQRRCNPLASKVLILPDCPTSYISRQLVRQLGLTFRPTRAGHEVWLDNNNNNKEEEKKLLIVGRLSTELLFQFTKVVSGVNDATGTANVTITRDAALPVVDSSDGGSGGNDHKGLVLGQDFLATNSNNSPQGSGLACLLQAPNGRNQGPRSPSRLGWLYLFPERILFLPY
ncbi:hypothetical protein TYRP_017353 [Tyrophagus putrescentiae]|nr:hypothetical protein TYRP_017353 [Tyrophagus putrescentiae]